LSDTKKKNDGSDAPKTVAEAVYRRLRADILWGRLPPGAPLRSDELRKNYEVGVSPLREALSRLSSERLVTSSGQRGFKVAPITSDLIQDIFETRLVIERSALTRSIVEGKVDWETRVVASHHALSRIPLPASPGPDAENWTTKHRSFHMALISACGSQWQTYLSGLLFDQAERFRIVRVKDILAQQDDRDPAKEHQTIMQAALDRDIDAALQALEDHYNGTKKVALAALENTGALND